MSTVSETAPAASVSRPSPLGLFACAALLLGLFTPLLIQLAGIWELDSNYSHGYFILPISLWIAWTIARENPLPAEGDVFQGTFTLGVGLLFHFVGLVLRFLPIELAALMLVLRGTAVLLGGRTWANKFLFPTAFLVFLFPLPVEWTTRIAVALQDVIAGISGEVMGWFVLSVRQGHEIRVANVPEPLVVGQECSGIRQLMAFVAMGALVAYIGRVGLARGILLMVLAVPVAVAANVVRILAMGFGRIWFGPEWIASWMHDIPALITLPLGIAMFFALVWLIAPTSDAPSDGGRS